MMVLLKRFFTPVIITLVFLLWVAFGLWMFFAEGGYLEIIKLSNGAIIPDVYLFHSKDNLIETFSDWGKQGRLYYIRYQYRDFIYPIIYSSLLSGILIRLIRPKYFNIWVFVPVLAMIFDFAENYFLRVLVYDFPNLINSNIIFASVFSSLKWFTILICIVLIYIAYNNRRKQYQSIINQNRKHSQKKRTERSIKRREEKSKKKNNLKESF